MILPVSAAWPCRRPTRPVGQDRPLPPEIWCLGIGTATWNERAILIMGNVYTGDGGIDSFDSENQIPDSGLQTDALQTVELSLDDPRLVPFVAAHPSGTVYHHPAWLRTLSAEYHRGIVILACQNHRGHLAGIFPLMNTRGVPLALFGGPGKARLSSLPRTPIAGPLCAGREASRLLVNAAIDRVSQARRLRLQVKTEGPLLDSFAENFF